MPLVRDSPPDAVRVGSQALTSRLRAMSSISRDEVARVAGLARIDLTPAELDRLAGELDVIVQAVARVSEVATASTYTIQRRTAPVATRAPRASASSPAADCVTTSRRRLEKRSASTPP